MSNSTDLNFALGDNAAQEIKRYANNIVSHMNEIDEIRQHIKDAKAEAKANGFDPKALTAAVRAMRADSQEARIAIEQAIRMYIRATGLEVAD